MFYLLGVASILVVLQTEQTEAVCGLPVVWRNNNITCPERAICADVFDIMRDWYNGTRCHERRILHNCMCDGDNICPTTDAAHRLYASQSHELYVCRPTCRLPWCGNIRMAPTPVRTRSRTRGRGRGRGGRLRTVRTPVAFTSIQNAVEFGGKAYNKMSCRCPRHHFPSTTRRRDRSVKANGWEYNYALGRGSTLYVCDTRASDPPREDPCS